METLTKPIKTKDFLQLTDQLGKEFAKRTPGYDATDTFVKENYDELKEHRFFTAMIPEELGGAGISHAQMCDVLRKIAHYDSSTALAMSMHQHLIAANVWKYKHGKGGEDVLKKVVDKELILISTGAKDWLESNGTMEKVDGGYLVTAKKHFASQASVGNIIVTSAPYQDPNDGWVVLHFPVPMNAEGVSVDDDWYTMGMRGTGSHTINLEKVFVPESAIVLKRPRGEYHIFWNVVLTVAMPLIMSVYVGIAEKAAELAVNAVKGKAVKNPHLPYLVGEMHHELTNAQVVLKNMIGITYDFDFQPTDENGQKILARKTIVANAAKQTVEKAMKVVGGRSYFRSMQLERLFRDVQASEFHPLPEITQYHFTGEYLLKGNTLSF